MPTAVPRVAQNFGPHVYSNDAFTPALLILIAAPLSFGAAFALLLATGTELNVLSPMGLILLVGLVVKNGMVLIDYAHRRHAVRGRGGTGWPRATPSDPDDHALHVVRFAPTRTRAWIGRKLQKPLALTVIGGLSRSTVITLYAAPSLYVALHRERA